jgi:hypothetical protein
VNSGTRYIIEAKTANYTIADNDFGKTLTTRGAGGSVTFTLPDPATTPSGVWVDFFTVAGQTTVITTTADKLTTFNDATATSITFSEAGHLIGNFVRCICDGTTWLVAVASDELQTAVVA